MINQNLAGDNIKKLASLFPNAITETINKAGEVIQAVDFDVLRQELGATIKGRTLRYEFNWPDKDKALKLANTLTDKALRLDRDKSTGRDGTPRNIDTENVYIEGDNLDALQILRQTYMGKVKMIYIDPPYNTGNDFIYNDKFTISTDDYEERYGEYVPNPESNGRFHTDWLNMIYPRLKVARDFLRPDGVIFISIDDNEVANLRKVCDEIFGNNNFMADIIVVSNPGGRDYKQIAIMHEHLLVYSKSDAAELNQLEREEHFDMDDDIGGYELRELRNRNPKFHSGNRPNLFFPIYVAPTITDNYGCCAVSLRRDNVYNIEVCPYNSAGEESVWRWGQLKVEREIRSLVARKKRDGNYNVYEKSRKSTSKAKSVWNETEMRNEDGTRLFGTLFEKAIFDHPKPLAILSRCLQLATDEDSIVLDFFSGSATTAHAVMALNSSDGGRRKFILVQLPEVTGEKSEARKAGYETICDIGEERIRRAGRKIRDESPLTIKDLDVGFRVFRVDSSNIKEEIYKRPDEYIQGQLELFDENIKPDRTPEDLLIQVMLGLGMELSTKIEEDFVAGKHVFIVNDGYLIACFDERINKQTITYMAKRQPAYVAFRDSCFEDDAMMINSDQLIKAYSPKTEWVII